MSKQTIGISEQLSHYILNTVVQEEEHLKALRQETMSLSEHRIQISPELGNLYYYW